MALPECGWLGGFSSMHRRGSAGQRAHAAMSCEFGSVECCRLYGAVLDCVKEENVGILKGQGPGPVTSSRSKLTL
jgi:hypothetical protein